MASFIKEFKVALPPGEHMDFLPGSYAQIDIPAYDLDYNNFDRSLIGDLYVPTWEKFGLFGLKQKNTEPTIRATIRMREISSPLRSVLPLLLSNLRSRDLALWMYLAELHLPISSASNLAIRL